MTVTSHPNEDQIQERLIALTRDLILIPSNLIRPEDRRRCYDFIKNHVESLENIEVREFEHKGIPSLVAAPPGCHEPDILMCGHLDVITHPDVSVYCSKIENGRIRGPGAGDMKGALAILLEVFRHVHTRLPNASLGLAVTADEEIGGEAGIGYLVQEKGLRCKAAMIPDGGSLNEITVEEKGILHIQLRCQGRSAHAARPWLGQNPIEKLIEYLATVRKFFEGFKKEEDSWYPTCAITIVGTENQTTNRIPTDAAAVLDIRFPPPHTVDAILQELKKILGADVEVKVLISAEPTHLSPDPLYQKITQEISGHSVRLIRDDGGSDGRYFASEGISVMMSRPIVGNLHAIDEWIDTQSMLLLYQIYERYLLEKLQGA